MQALLRLVHRQGLSAMHSMAPSVLVHLTPPSEGIGAMLRGISSLVVLSEALLLPRKSIEIEPGVKGKWRDNSSLLYVQKCAPRIRQE